MKRARQPISILLAVLLAVSLALSACTSKTGGFESLSDTPRSSEASVNRETGKTATAALPYSQMTYERPSFDELRSRVTQLTAEAAQASDLESLLAIEEELEDLSNAYWTMDTLAELHSYHDTSDTYWQEEHRIVAAFEIEFHNLILDFYRPLIAGPLADSYREEVGEFAYQQILNSLLLSSPEVVDLMAERNALDVEYNEMLAAQSADETFSGNYAQAAPEFARIYIRMMELDKAVARQLGFSSPAEMYYLTYERDYTPRDALTLCAEVQESFTPLIGPIFQARYSSGSMSLDSALALMPNALRAIDPELTTAWYAMRTQGLCDLDGLTTKQPGAFTTKLYSYDAPFLYMSWDGSFNGATTLHHEFGHFYDFWLRDKDTITSNNLDIAESYSQGLEVLMMGQYETLTTDQNSRGGRMEKLADLLVGAILQQAAFEEFQMRAYELEKPDYHDLARLFSQVMGEYGMGSGTGEDHDWYTISHFFDAPFYTISYVTSALVALQIWSLSTDDYDLAVKTYLRMIHADQAQSFTALLEESGLRSVRDPAVLRDIAHNIELVFVRQ